MSKAPTVILTADLGYGDAGKGSIVDYLTRTTGAHTIVRYNGGAQAAHTVVTPGGRAHTFAQFGSGMFIPGTQTHLSRFMLLHPLAMLAEERHLRGLGVDAPFARTTIERGALVITPYQQAANRLKEIARGAGRHGSCGMGIGETTADWLAYGDEMLFAGDLFDRALIVKKLGQMREAKIAQLEPLLAGLASSGADGRTAQEDQIVEQERKLLFDPDVIEMTADIYRHFAGLVRIVEPAELENRLSQPGVTIFEGAQGVLLDEWWGFYPYNSWSTLTFKNANTLLAESRFSGQTLRLGIIRGYATRHGAGPFVTEDADLTARLPEGHNTTNPWQRDFRAGPLDLVALRYALKVLGPLDGLAVTNLDRMDKLPEWRICNAYQPADGAPDADPAAATSPDIDSGDPFFERAGRLIYDIRVPADPTDLVKQEQLTRQLMALRPVYTRCEPQRETYLGEISRGLGGLPIAITSAGLTAREKVSYFYKGLNKSHNELFIGREGI